MIFGLPTFVLSATDSVIGHGAGLRQRAGSRFELIPSPEGLKSAEGIRAVARPDGRVEAVWSALADSLHDVHTLWYAELEGGRWSNPTLIATIRAQWADYYSSHWSELVPISAAELSFAVTGVVLAEGEPQRTLLSAETGTALVFRGSGAGWSWAAVPRGQVPGRPNYVRLAKLDDDTLAVIAIGAADVGPGRRDSNSLFASRSTDGGQSWSPFALVQLSGSMPGYDPHLLRVGSGPTRNLVLVWRAHGGSGGDSVFARRSYDGGDTWIPLESAAIGGSSEGMAAIGLCGGGFEVVVSMSPAEATQDGGPPVPRLLSMQRGPERSRNPGWVRREIEGPPTWSPPTMAALGPNSVLLVGSTARDPRDPALYGKGYTALNFVTTRNANAVGAACD